MQVRIQKMRTRGVEIDRRLLRDTVAVRGLLIVADVTDQGLHRPCKVARLMQGLQVRAELKDVNLVWMNDGRMTLAGYERVMIESGQAVDFRQSWLVTLDNELGLTEPLTRKVSPSR